ncbi:MAG: DUF547 domain-containing protein [Alphaproteobacteria bacterium]|nr:DUF547 domain-containing protein [Alphaproteobacteria bacterium]
MFRFRPPATVLAHLAGALLLALSVATGAAQAAPKSDLWPRWQAHDPASTATVDHAAWDRLLAAHVRPSGIGVNLFDYGGVDSGERAALDGYIARLSGTAVSALNRDEQLAYWINFYNALTIQVVLDHMPVDSILDIDISPGFFSIGPWGRKLVTVEGEALSLDDIEHRILRPIWNDPRIHYGVNCASIGCPNLLPVAYTAGNVDRLLTENAVAYVNDPRGAELRGGQLTVSNIYDWFEEDFGGNETGVLRHLRQYAKPELRKQLELVLEIDGYDYDWSLNDVAR